MEETSRPYYYPNYQNNPSSSSPNANFGHGSSVQAVSQVGSTTLANVGASFPQPQSSPLRVQNNQALDGADKVRIEDIILRLASLSDPEEFCNAWLESYQIYSKNLLSNNAKDLKKVLD